MSMKLYRWSNDKELLLIHSDQSKRINILGWRVNPERVLLRLDNSFCHPRPKQLCMEVTAQKNNNSVSFYFWSVKVITDGFSDASERKGFEVYDNKYWSYLCGEKSCFYEVKGKVGSSSSSEEKMNWEFSHWYLVSGEIRIEYKVMIECDKKNGLKAELRGPFKCCSLEKKLTSEPSLTLQKMKKEQKPAEKAEEKFVESKIKLTTEYVLFAGGSQQRPTLVIYNTGDFHGNGNGCFVYT